jgi:hypothetical protein
MNRWLKRGLIGVGAIVVCGISALAVYAKTQSSAFDASMAKVYEVPVPAVARSTEPSVIARGKHVAESMAACATRDCHGTDLGGGKPIAMGPLGTFTGPNISPGGLGAAYTDGELARLIRHGIKKDGRSLRFMPVQDFSWLPDDEIAAVVSYMRTVPAVDRQNGLVAVGTLGKVLDRRGQFILDVARVIDHGRIEQVPAPAPTAEYGRYVVRLCTGCHGERLSGGKIPGTPSSVPIPPNLTSHESGLKDWTYEDFDRAFTKGLRKNGKAIDPFMPFEGFSKFDEIEKKALWARLRELPPLALGNR